MSVNRESMASGFIWRLLERTGAQMVTLIVSIVLARLLDPDIYGTIALVTVFTTILQVFVDSGLGNALIQKRDADDLDFSTVFYFNVVMCLALYVVMFLSAPYIALFYERSELTLVIRVLSLVVVISGVKNVLQAYISRYMLFKKFFYATLGGTIGAAVVGITMAYLGYGVWALVGQHLFNTFVDTTILWIVVKWYPRKRFSFERLKGLFSFGWKLLASSLLDKVYQELRLLLIGKIYSEADLAFYNQGQKFPSIIITNINTSIDSILLPTMSSQQDNRERVKAMTRRAIRISTYVIAPMMIGLAVCAESLVTLLLTEKWLGCAFFLRIFCITYIFYPIHTANLNAIKALGRSDMFLKLEIAKKVVGLALLLSTMFISVKAMAYSLLLGTLISTLINAFPNRKLLEYSWFEQIKDILPHIGLAVVMGIPVLLIGQLPLPAVAVLCIQVLTGAVVYIALSAIVKLEAFYYVLDIAKSFLGKLKIRK